jgi:hypothetical protein
LRCILINWDEFWARTESNSLFEFSRGSDTTSNSVSNMRISHSLKALFSRYRSSSRGNIAIISALAMPCLVGFCGMGADVGYWYYRQRVLQAAVDIAAYNGAIALSAGASTSSVISGGSSDASSNGWQSAHGTVTVHTPPASGSQAGNTNSVEVILTENEPRYFSNLFLNSTVKVSVRAVAKYTIPGNLCMLALDKTANNALQFWGHNTSSLPDCTVMSDSLNNNSLGIGGGSSVTVGCAIAVGSVDVSSTLHVSSCSSATSHSQPAPDPYASVAAPPIPGTCQSVTSPMQPGKYCGGLTIKDTRTLNPGVYVISGGNFTLNANANISGSNVMFYLTNGATLKFNGNATFNLSAPTTAPYTGGQSGILFFSDRSQSTASQSFNGTSSSVLTGALYFPTQALTVNGDFTGANGCMQIIADTISFSGNSTLSSNCAAYGINSVPAPGATALVE